MKEREARLRKLVDELAANAEAVPLGSLAQAIAKQKDCTITLWPIDSTDQVIRYTRTTAEGTEEFILCPSKPADSRTKFAVAHELAHILLDHRPSFEKYHPGQELEANILAESLLFSQGERAKESDAEDVGRTKEGRIAHDVFICHSSVDKEFARRLSSDLKSNGIKVWFDEFEMFPGDSLYEKIQSVIRSSAWFVIVLSPDSVSSKWCKRELHNAMEEENQRDRLFVVPVLHRDCEIPGFLKETVWADCRATEYKNGLARLMAGFTRRSDAT